MVGKLLVRGMLAGLVAGLLVFLVGLLVGEPPLEQAIALEAAPADTAQGHVAEHSHGTEPFAATAATAAAAPAHEHGAGGGHDHGGDGEELVSRDTQSGVGLLTGAAVYGASVGGLFALVFAFAYGRMGRIGVQPLAAWLALAAFVALVLVPGLKYPANPPAVGNPDTIGLRTGLFFLSMAISVAAMVFALSMRTHLVARLGAWNASVAAGLLFVAIVVVVQFALPEINEVSFDFPAALLWKFRLASMGMQAVLWATIGLLFGALVERSRLLAPR